MMKNRILSLFLVFLGIQYGFSQKKLILGFTDSSSAKEFSIEKQFDQSLKADEIGQSLKIMSSKPHHLGSPGGKEVAEYILQKFKDHGLDAKIETYTVLFPTPKTRLLEMTGPSFYKALLKEPGIPEDVTSGQEGQLPTYNAWSADGDVTSELVYVNFGLPEDYDKLDAMGISVKGKIVIARYGRSWRGIKPKVAQEHGAIGCIIYSDPKDDGYMVGEVYPKGAFKNEFGVQRGSVLDMPIYPGDPLTPGYGSTKNAKRLERKEATNLLKIPVLPISYHDAEPLLAALEGPVVPEEDWRGGLPITYHIGPGKSVVHLKLEFDWKQVPCHDIIGIIKGSQFPDEWIVRGNHHDAWVNGANDPLSGQAAMIEETKALGDLLKTGWKPKRTLVYCAWDGEEPSLIGSTEWGEDHGKELQDKTVLYVNSDGNGRGFLGAEGSHALESFVTEITQEVKDPQTQVSIYDRKRAHELITTHSTLGRKDLLDAKVEKLGALGSGSDFSVFLQHLGIPTLNFGFGGEDPGGEYHSIYDSYDNYTRFKDPGFRYGVALASIAGRAILRMANADILPFDYRSLAKTIKTYTNELIDLTGNLRESTVLENQFIKAGYYGLSNDPNRNLKAPAPKLEVPYLDFSPIQNALLNLEKSTNLLSDTWSKNLKISGEHDDFNKKLYLAEQKLLSDEGLPRRGWYKHILYAPGFYTGYGVKTLPGIREAIEQRKWVEAQAEIQIAAKKLNDLAIYLGN